MRIVEYNKENYDEALLLRVHEHQEAYVPLAMESLALAYIKPWDEAFDPYLIEDEDEIIGAFYLSYTPDSEDNYWLGGYFLDKDFQGRGLGYLSFVEILIFLKRKYKKMKVLKLTVVKGNEVAVKVYESFGFTTDGKENAQGEVIYQKKIR